MFLLHSARHSVRASSIQIARNGLQMRAQIALMSSTADKFDEAKERLLQLNEEPGNTDKLKIYGLFKQATKGAVDTKRPGMMDMVGRAKWDSWKAYENMSKEEAQLAYVKLVDELAGSQVENETAQTQSDQKYKHLLVERDGKLMKITLNRPKKKNALLYECYDEWMTAMDEAKDDPKIVMLAITGAGDYFCSGNDLSNFQNIDLSKLPELSRDASDLVQKFIGKIIDFPKPLVAVVNGPAVGIGVTTLALYDLVYASDKATFSTPFANLGQCPEGCSSYTFPRLFGIGKATEILLFNKKINAKEAFDGNLVTEVFPHDKLNEQVWPRLKAYSELPKGTLIYGKKNMVHMNKDKLHEINKLECDLLCERFQSEECKTAVMKFFMRKSK